MTLLTPVKARAYVNFGRWIADCPMACGSAMSLESNQGLYCCTECKQISEIEWPDNADGIWEALLKRPAPRNRNWFPASHELALRSGCPHGQTPRELDDETADHRE